MAKSLHVTIQEKDNFEISHKGQSASFELPSRYQSLKNISDRDHVLEWFELEFDDNERHAAIQKFIAQDMIDCRAAGRPTIKRVGKREDWLKIRDGLDSERYHIDDTNQEYSLVLWEDNDVQERIDKTKLEPLPVPGSGKKPASVGDLIELVKSGKASAEEMEALKEAMAMME